MTDLAEMQDWADAKKRWADDRRNEPGQRSYAFNVADEAIARVISLAGEVERLGSTLIAARAEVDRWGYGDFHWGETPRDEGVLAMLAQIDAALSSHPSEPEA